MPVALFQERVKRLVSEVFVLQTGTKPSRDETRFEEERRLPGQTKPDDAHRFVRVVQIDPLWVEAPVSLAQARRYLKEGQAAAVFFDSAGKKAAGEGVPGKIILIDSVADAGSDTLKVRVELPNPQQRPAGEHVRVVFPEIVKAAGQSALQSSNALTRPG